MSDGAATGDLDADPLDGRLQRTARSRRLVVQTFLDLVDHGEPQPTAQQVADRSGLSMRTIFRLFQDVEELHSVAIATQIARVAALIVPLEPVGPLDDRVRALVDSRARVFEAISPVRRVAVRLAATSPAIRTELASANRFFRAQLAQVFDVELTVLAAPHRRDLLDALDMVTSWETWERLRSVQLVSERRARRILTDLSRALLVESPTGARPSKY